MTARPFRVATLGGLIARYGSLARALEVAAVQARCALTSPCWSVRNVATGETWQVDRAGVVTRLDPAGRVL